MQYNLSEEYKEWLSDNLEWFIQKLGFQSFQQRHFVSLTDNFLLQFQNSGAFLIDEFIEYLKELLELNDLPEVIVGENIVDLVDGKVRTLPHTESTPQEQIRVITQEFLLIKAHSIGLDWEGEEDDSSVILVLSSYFGLTELLFDSNYSISIRNIVIEKDIICYVTALVLSLKPEEQIAFLSTFNEELKEQISDYINNDNTLAKLQTLKQAFANNDGILMQLSQAEELASNEYFPLAITILEKICLEHPQRTSYWKTLASYHQKNKDYKNSLKALHKALRITPKDPFILTNIAYNLIFLKKVNESEDFLLEAEEIAPKNTLNLRNNNKQLKVITHLS